MTEWESAVLPDGTTVRLRDIGEGDAPLLQDLVHHMSLADTRFRFFAPLRELGPALVQRLSHPRPGVDVALGAFAREAETLLGVARFSGDDGGHTGEYAVAVRTDQKGHGIGWLLMRRLVGRVAALGYGTIRGDVLRDNERMLQMVRELGFSVADHPDEADLYEVRLDLRSQHQRPPLPPAGEGGGEGNS